MRSKSAKLAAKWIMGGWIIYLLFMAVGYVWLYGEILLFGRPYWMGKKTN